MIRGKSRGLVKLALEGAIAAIPLLLLKAIKILRRVCASPQYIRRVIGFSRPKTAHFMLILKFDLSLDNYVKPRRGVAFVKNKFVTREMETACALQRVVERRTGETAE